MVDVAGLYHPGMSDEFEGGVDRIIFQGEAYYYAKPRKESNSIVGVNFFGILRFVNWLHNDRPTGAQGPDTTEDGAYTLTPQGLAESTVVRNENARFVLPTEDEWYKAAYYKGGGVD